MAAEIIFQGTAKVVKLSLHNGTHNHTVTFFYAC